MNNEKEFLNSGKTYTCLKVVEDTNSEYVVIDNPDLVNIGDKVRTASSYQTAEVIDKGHNIIKLQYPITTANCHELKTKELLLIIPKNVDMKWQDKMQQFVVGFLTETYGKKYSLDVVDIHNFIIYEDEIPIFKRTTIVDISNHWQANSSEAINAIHRGKLLKFQTK